MDDFLWTKGEDLALVWPGGIVMLPSDVPHEAATSVWQVARDGADLGAILQHLTDVLGVSLLAMPMFAIVLVSEDRARVAVRGDWGVEMDAADGRHLVRGSGITTWSEQSFEDVVGITLGRDLTAEGAELPIVSGVVRVARVTTRPRRGVLEEQRLSDDPEGDAVDARQLLVEPAASLNEVVEASWASPSDDPVPDVPVEEQLNLEAAPLEDESVPEGDKEPDGELDDSLEHEGEQADPSDADADADTPAGDPDPTARWATSLDADDLERPESAAGAAATLTVSVPDSDVIASVPGRERQPGPHELAPGLAHVRVDEFVDHDGATVVDFRLPAGLIPTGVDGGTVLALVCPAGHPNRPHERTCRSCSAALVGGVPQEVTRPPLGRVRSSTGEDIPLTGPILVGRSPRASRFTGTTVPRLLALPFPHVSSSHAEIRLEGWSVFVVDLNSRNGTYLRRRDEPPVRVTEPPLMLQHGDILDFGHGVRLTFEDLP